MFKGWSSIRRILYKKYDGSCLVMKKEEYLAHFEAYLLAEKRVSQNTFSAYRNDVGQFMRFLDKQKLSIKNCQLSDLKRFITDLKNQDMTLKSLSRKISALKLFYGFLHKNFRIENIAKLLVFPKLDKTLPRYLTDEEIEKLLRVASEDNSPLGIRNKVIVFLLYASGMRVSELVNMTTGQIDFDNGFLRLVGKGNKERVVPLPQNVMKLLGYYLDTVHKSFLPKGKKNNQYLFVSSKRNQTKPLTRQMVWNVLKGLIVKSNIKKNISPHSLRHSLATHLLRNGANLRVLQMLLGHENLKTVEVYTHIETSHLRAIYDKKHPRG